MIKFPRTKRFLKHLEKQVYFVSQSNDLINQGYEKYLHKLARLNAYVEIYYKLEQEEELMLKSLYFYSALNGNELAMMDVYASVCQNRPLEAIDRLTSKEIDYYLRDDMKTSSFEFYPNELFDFLSIGESLKKLQIKEKVVLPMLDVEKFGAFSDLSTSEQFEMVEDILGEYFFTDYPEYGGKIICEDIGLDEITFSLNDCNPSIEILDKIDQLIRFHFCNSELKTKFN